MKLTKNFNLEEFFCSPGSRQYFDSLTPAAQDRIIRNIRKLAESLQVYRDWAGVPFTVTSGLRSPDRNAAVGGAGSSTHMDGKGCDFVVGKEHRAKLHRKMSAEWNGGYSFYTDGHFHADVGAKRRW